MVVSLFLGVHGLRAGSGISRADPKHRVIRSRHLDTLVSTRNQVIAGIRHAGWESAKDRKRVRNRLGVGSVESNSRFSGTARLPQSIYSHPPRCSRNLSGKHFFANGTPFRSFLRHGKRRKPLAEACSSYSDLQEFEDLFRAHFRDFLTRQLEKEIVPRKRPLKGHYWKSKPFRGLQFFDFEHAPVFHGRTKAVGEVLDALAKQANCEKPFCSGLGRQRFWKEFSGSSRRSSSFDGDRNNGWRGTLALCHYSSGLRGRSF